MNRREFLGTSAAGIASGAALACQKTAPSGSSRDLLVKSPEHPTPSTLDKMPLEWHKERARILQERTGAQGVDDHQRRTGQ